MKCLQSVDSTSCVLCSVSCKWYFFVRVGCSSVMIFHVCVEYCILFNVCYLLYETCVVVFGFELHPFGLY
jgi:hypothetical protein